MNRMPTESDRVRLAEVARLMAVARENIDAAAALLLSPAGMIVADTLDVTMAYMTEWQRLTRWRDSGPVSAYQYVCQNEWTGGSLTEPGEQNTTRWPVGFGTPSC